MATRCSSTGHATDRRSCSSPNGRACGSPTPTVSTPRRSTLATSLAGGYSTHPSPPTAPRSRWSTSTSSTVSSPTASIVVLDLASGELRTVLQPASLYRQFLEYPRWSPDGRSLVVEIERTDADVPQFPPNPPTTGSVIAVADISGAIPAPLTILTPWEMFAAYPDWHPTDDRIVFSTKDLSVFQTTTERREPAHHPRRRHRADTGHHLRRPRHSRDPAELDARRQPDHLHARSVAALASPFGEYGVRETAFIDPDGTGLEVIDEPGRTHPRLRPTP